MHPRQACILSISLPLWKICVDLHLNVVCLRCVVVQIYQPLSSPHRKGVGAGTAANDVPTMVPAHRPHTEPIELQNADRAPPPGHYAPLHTSTVVTDNAQYVQRGSQKRISTDSTTPEDMLGWKKPRDVVAIYEAVGRPNIIRSEGSDSSLRVSSHHLPYAMDEPVAKVAKRISTAASASGDAHRKKSTPANPASGTSSHGAVQHEPTEELSQPQKLSTGTLPFPEAASDSSAAVVKHVSSATARDASAGTHTPDLGFQEDSERGTCDLGHQSGGTCRLAYLCRRVCACVLSVFSGLFLAAKKSPKAYSATKQ